MKKWFISYHSTKGSGFRIMETKYDLDTETGLLAVVNELEKEYGSAIVPIGWKQLKN